MHSIKYFMRCNRGVALIEFGIILPVLLLLLFGTIEVSRFALINQKLDKIAHAMADFSTQGVSIRSADLDNYSAAIDQIISPLSFSGTVIFTSAVFYDNGIPPCQNAAITCISWQQKRRGNDVSRVGAIGGSPLLPGGYAINPGQGLIIVEVFLDYTPLLSLTASLVPALSDQKLYKIATYKPRQRNLGTLSN